MQRRNFENESYNGNTGESSVIVPPWKGDRMVHCSHLHCRCRIQANRKPAIDQRRKDHLVTRDGSDKAREEFLHFATSKTEEILYSLADSVT